jgi:hypothetical protein
VNPDVLAFGPIHAELTNLWGVHASGWLRVLDGATASSKTRPIGLPHSSLDDELASEIAEDVASRIAANRAMRAAGIPVELCRGESPRSKYLMELCRQRLLGQKASTAKAVRRAGVSPSTPRSWRERHEVLRRAEAFCQFGTEFSMPVEPEPEPKFKPRPKPTPRLEPAPPPRRRRHRADVPYWVENAGYRR